MAWYSFVNGTRRDYNTKVGALVAYRNGATLYNDLTENVTFWVKQEPETGGKLIAFAFTGKSRPRSEALMEQLLAKYDLEIEGFD